VCAEEIKALNHSYRGINNVTDVLSFPQEKWPRPLVFQREPKTLPKDSGPPKTLGDVVICLEKAESNAAEIGQDLDREFCFLLVHGFLHLCGHDHQNETEEALMTEQQQLIMSLFANSESGAIWKHCVSIQGSET
jgi:probable rRNA maturation factor